MLSEMSILGIVYTFNVVSSGNMIVQRLNFQFLEYGALPHTVARTDGAERSDGETHG